jgi:hypothetical protein
MSKGSETPYKKGDFVVNIPLGIIYYFQATKFLMFFLPKGFISFLFALGISFLGYKLARNSYPKVHSAVIFIVMSAILWVVNWLIYPNF